MWTNIEQTAYAYTGGKPFDGNLPCVIFLHGAQNDHSVWALQSRYLAHHGYAVLAFDLPGHGRSALAALAEIGAMAQWVLDQMTQLGLASAHCIGHSMGSLIALEMAGLAPHSVLSLALLGTAAPMPVGEALLDSTRESPLQAIDQINAWSHRTSIHAYTTHNPGSNPIGTGQRLMQRMLDQHGAGVLQSDFNACNTYDKGITRSEALCVNTLVMNGINDAMTQAKSAKTLASHIPAHLSKLVLLERCGHALMSEQPDAVLSHLVQHLKRC